MQELDLQNAQHTDHTGDPALDELAEVEPHHDLYSHPDPENAPDNEPESLSGLTRRRLIAVLIVLLVLVLLAVVPPLINVGRYRRRIASSISLSLGRPVHIDSVTLNILPMPGFTLENFVVQDDPAFSAEPVLRAQQVRATLRINSLWRRRVEFSRISLDDPSVNLVHRSDGQWNLESILLQASRMPAAPTQQKGAGDAPRFPYIEATGGRVNLKMGLEKMPISLTDADFALWLPEPHQWRLRLKANPSRTDAAATDTGFLRVEGTLGQAATLADVPIDLTGRWTSAPLGAVSRLLTGSDAGLRGQMTLAASIHGTLAANQLQSLLELRELRRADFVPAAPLNANIACTVVSSAFFHSFDQLHCIGPATSNSSPSASFNLSGKIPDIFHAAASADFTATVQNLPAASVLDLLRIASQRIPATVKVAGTLDATLFCCVAPHTFPSLATNPPPPSPETEPFRGEFKVADAGLSMPGSPPLLDSDISGSITGIELTVDPVDLVLGGKEPATLDLHADPIGYTMHLAGPLLRSRWQLLAQAFPQLNDGMDQALPPPIPPASTSASQAAPSPVVEIPIRVDLTAHRTWIGTQTWHQTPPTRPASHPRRTRTRR